MTVNLTALVTATLVSLVTVPIVLTQAMQRGLVDPSGGRKSHTVEVPRLGGIGILVGWLAGLIAASCIAPHDWWNPKTWGVLGGALIIFVTGLVDDLRHDPASGQDGLPAPLRFALQFVGAAVPVACGVRITYFSVPFDGSIAFLPIAAWVITLLWIVAVTNALNFIDGLDGLAGGVSLIMAATIALVAMYGPNQDLHVGEAILALALLGGIIGFLRLNFPPASIFMGDGGATLLGYLLATLAVSGLMKGAAVMAIGPPILILALPIVNLAQVVVGRVLRGQNPMAADRTHLHDRLQDAGWSDYSAVLFIYAVCGLFASAALSLIGLGTQAAALSVLVAGLLVALAARRPQRPQIGQPDPTGNPGGETNSAA